MDKVQVELASRVGKHVQYKAVSVKITINTKAGRKLTKAEPMAGKLTSVVRLDCLLTDTTGSGKQLASFPGSFLTSPKNKGDILGTRPANCSAVLYVLTL